MITNEVINKDIKKTNNKIWISLLVIILGIGLFFSDNILIKNLKKMLKTYMMLLKVKGKIKKIFIHI